MPPHRPGAASFLGCSLSKHDGVSARQGGSAARGAHAGEAAAAVGPTRMQDTETDLNDLPGLFEVEERA